MAPLLSRLGLRFSSNELSLTSSSDDHSLSVHRREGGRRTSQPLGLQREAHNHVKKVMQEADQLAQPQVIRNLAGAYTLCMVVVGALALAGQIFAQVRIKDSYQDAYVVNVAGRQRMLDQKIAKNALALLAFSGTNRNLSGYAVELQYSLETFYAAHYGLQEGDDEIGVPPTRSGPILALFKELQPNFDVIYASGKALVRAAEQAGLQAANLSTAVIQPDVEEILAREDSFFLTMDAIVSKYDERAREHLDTLLIITWSTTGVLLLTILLEGLLVFRPVLSRMQKLVGERFDLLRASLAAEASARSVTLLMVEYVAHEVQEPLAAALHSIKAAGKLLKEARKAAPEDEACRDTGEEEEKEEEAAGGMGRSVDAAVDFLREAQESCRLMATVVDDVADMRKLEGGQLSLQLGSVKASELVRRSLQMVAQPSPGVTLSHAVDAAVDAIDFVTDEHRLQQVLIGLVSNGLRFTDRGFVRVQVSAPHLAWLRFEVADSGRGLSEEACAKVLMPFSGVPDTRGQSGNAGMGLYIVKLLVEALGGSLGVSSKEGEGTTFWVLLPSNPNSPKTGLVSMPFESPAPSTSRTESHKSGPGSHPPNEAQPKQGPAVGASHLNGIGTGADGTVPLEALTEKGVSGSAGGAVPSRPKSQDVVVEVVSVEEEGGNLTVTDETSSLLASAPGQGERPQAAGSQTARPDGNPVRRTDNRSVPLHGVMPAGKAGKPPLAQEGPAITEEEKCHRGGMLLSRLRGSVSEPSLVGVGSGSTAPGAAANEEARKTSSDWFGTVSSSGGGGGGASGTDSVPRKGWHKPGGTLGKVPESPSRSREVSLHAGK